MQDPGSYATGLSAQDSLARYSVISGGPNDDLVYFSDPILQEYNPFTEINRDALTNDQNSWYLSHPTSGNTGGVCRQRELERGVLEYFEGRMVEAVDSVEAHWPQSTLQASIEAIASASVAAQAGALGAAVSAQDAQVDSVLSQLGEVSPPCTLLF